MSRERKNGLLPAPMQLVGDAVSKRVQHHRRPPIQLKRPVLRRSLRRQRRRRHVHTMLPIQLHHHINRRRLLHIQRHLIHHLLRRRQRTTNRIPRQPHTIQPQLNHRSRRSLELHRPQHRPRERNDMDMVHQQHRSVEGPSPGRILEIRQRLQRLFRHQQRDGRK